MIAARFALLLSAMFAAIGTTLPFFPPFLAAAGLSPQGIAAVLFAGSLTRMVAGPLLGRVADRRGMRGVLAICALAAAAVQLAFALVPWGMAGVIVVMVALHVLYSCAMGPLIPLSESLTVSAARNGAFDYGRVRSIGSVAFIAASAVAGVLVGAWGLGVIPLIVCAALLVAAFAALLLPEAAARRTPGHGSFMAPLSDPLFRRILILSALIQGSHAAAYGFSAIHWAAAGHSATTIGLLWAEGVVAEIILFLYAKPLAERLGWSGLTMLAAGAGLVRWAILAETTWLPALIFAQSLHALTFGAQHLCAMRLLSEHMPAGQVGAAQTLHSSLGTGLSIMLMTLLSGQLYASIGGQMFWAMWALCVPALFLARGLKDWGK
ncbi:3-phenylpropionate MFS transporter [Plastoroseomonas arctica]|nr:3-phenylpropionate MFS transporter [Plastoroseomonas arctica]